MRVWDIYEFNVSSGVLQGDPLSPILFALAVQHAFGEIAEVCEHGGAFADDLILASSLPELEKALASANMHLNPIGLSINFAKCKLILSPNVHPSAVAQFPTLRAIKVATGSDATVLGAPLLGRDLDSWFTEKLAKYNKDLTKLHKLHHTQTEYLLLRHCGGLVRFFYALKTVPPRWWSQTQLAALKKFALGKIDGIHKGRPDLKFTNLPAMPIKLGGLGLHDPLVTALSQFLACVSQGLRAFRRFVGNDDAVPVGTEDTMSDVGTKLGSIPDWILRAIDQGSPFRAARLSAALYLVARDSECPPEHLAFLKQADNPGRSAWLHCPPNKTAALFLDDDAFSLMTRWHMNETIVHSSQKTCAACGEPCDAFGKHAVNCGQTLSFYTRHNHLRAALVRLLRRSGAQVEFEQAVPGSAERPADLLVTAPWLTAKTAIDVSVVADPEPRSPLAEGSAVGSQTALKISKYKQSCAAANWEFVPYVVDVHGGHGLKANSFLKKLCAAIAAHTGERYATVMGFARGSLSTAVAKGVLTQIQHSIYNSQQLAVHAPDGARELPVVCKIPSSLDDRGDDSLESPTL